MDVCFLGIDIGTTGTKTVLFDGQFRALAHETISYAMREPHDKWAEQDPDDWLKATVSGIKSVLERAGIDGKRVEAVGLSGQMHGLVLLDKEGKVLRPAMLWCDQRTAAECAEITDIAGADRLIEITANPAVTGFTAAKIRWVQKNEPELYQKAAKILLPKDYVRLRLTGEFASDVSDASGTQLLDVKKRRWSHELCSALAIDQKLLPELYESFWPAGRITSEAARLTGLRSGCLVAGGAGDQAASALGNGIVEEGLVSDTLGTSGVVFSKTERPLIDLKGRVHTFCHADGSWHVMGVTQGAGLSLRWFRDNFFDSEKGQNGFSEDMYARMIEGVADVPAGSRGVTFLPYLMGERSPHLDPDAKGVFCGLTNTSGKSEMLRSVLEGVAFSQRDCLEVIRSLGVRTQTVRLSGGGARSEAWRRILCDVLGTAVCTVNNSEGGALGAAILAAVCAGVQRDVKSACKGAIREKEIMLPAQASLYQQPYKRYRALYRALKPLFRS